MSGDTKITKTSEDSYVARTTNGEGQLGYGKGDTKESAAANSVSDLGREERKAGK